jgi:Flp pilus assembly pilin Flp
METTKRNGGPRRLGRRAVTAIEYALMAAFAALLAAASASSLGDLVAPGAHALAGAIGHAGAPPGPIAPLDTQ